MMSRKPYHSASHCKYLIQYHIIWCPKFRFSVLHGKADMTLKQSLPAMWLEHSKVKVRLNYLRHIQH